MNTVPMFRTDNEFEDPQVKARLPKIPEEEYLFGKNDSKLL